MISLGYLIKKRVNIRVALEWHIRKGRIRNHFVVSFDKIMPQLIFYTYYLY